MRFRTRIEDTQVLEHELCDDPSTGLTAGGHVAWGDMYSVHIQCEAWPMHRQDKRDRLLVPNRMQLKHLHQMIQTAADLG